MRERRNHIATGRGRVKTAAIIMLAITMITPASFAAPVTRVSLCEGDTAECQGADVRVQNGTFCSDDDSVSCSTDAECGGGSCLGDGDFGLSIATGHLNDDGFEDYIVGAPRENRAYVFLGSLAIANAEGADRSISAMDADFILEGAADSEVGFSIAIHDKMVCSNAPAMVCASDADCGGGNACGAPAAIGAPDTQSGASTGQAFLISPSTWDTLASSPTINPIGGATGVTTVSGVAAGDQFGYAVAVGSIVSLNVADVAVSARNENNGMGAVYLMPQGISSLGAPTAAISGSNPNEGLGESLAYGDLFANGGTAELAIGAAGVDHNFCDGDTTISCTDDANCAGLLPATCNVNPGRVYVLAAPGANVALSTFGTPGVACVEGLANAGFFGFSLAVGDFVSAPGDELAVGAIYEDRFGCTGDPTQACVRDADCPGTCDLATEQFFNTGALYIYGSADFAGLGMACNDPTVGSSHSIFGRNNWDQLGFSTAAGDFNADGSPDLAFAARRHDRALVLDEVDEGAVYIIDGGDVSYSAWPHSTDCPDADCDGNPTGIDRMIFGGVFDADYTTTDELGFYIATGDVDQDGFPEVITSSVAHERSYLVSLEDYDGDGVRNVRDVDDDNDGILDSVETLDDADLDGIPNAFDIDSDGDGILDNFEAEGSSQTASGSDSDGDGLADNFEPSGLTPINSDASGEPDYLDLDSDNDGIVDNTEAQTTPPVAPGADGNNDGLADNYAPGLTPVNTDSLDVPDYIDSDTDNDGVADGVDLETTVADGWRDPSVCQDLDADTCDDCAVAVDGFGPLDDFDVADDGLDTDSDGECDDGDDDDDNDGIDDGPDTDPIDPDVCGDVDADTCDDCAVGTDDFGPLDDFDVANDGTDTDSDGACDAGDTDDDNDGVADGADSMSLNPDICQDLDADSCDDCAVGTDNFGPMADNNVANDGTDTDSDGACDAGDTDDDNDGVADGADSMSLNPDICQDLDADTCDDCAVGTDDFGPMADNDVANDGTDTDMDGICDAGDTDSDGDGVDDGDDSAPLDANVCRDVDLDTCDDCSSGMDDVANDGTDTDSDGACDAGDTDDDNDGVADGSDTDSLDPDVCQDLDADSCDDCAVGSDDFGAMDDFDPANDGTDTDSDGACDAGDADDDNDGVADGADTDPLDPDVCQDLDADTCDDCAVGTDDFGPMDDFDPANDGPDVDMDGACDAGDADSDNDGVDDGDDSAPLDPNVCRDVDNDSCDDCSSGMDDPANDGTDMDGDGICSDGSNMMLVDCLDSDPDVFPGNPEVCDNKDNDCDMTIDSFVTTCGVGECGAMGMCIAGADDCTPGAPSMELCDNLDNDCDGTVDTFATACGIGECGAMGMCLAGADDCTPGPPMAEVCMNGLDEDCDGVPDSPGCPVPPLDAGPVALDDEMIMWDGVTGATMYHLYRGDLATLIATGEYTQSSGPEVASFCMLDANQQIDPFMPEPGQVVFYLLSADNGSEEGGLGQTSGGEPRPNDNGCR